MIQFNLLPDVKLEYIRARRLKRTVILASGLVAGAALTLLILLFLGVAVFQKKHLNDLSADIKRDSSKLEAVPDINKVLTVQNQLNDLTDLHNKKPVASRIFTYVQQITPKSANIEQFDIDFEAQTMIVTGSADSISAVNQFVDTLKFTDFKTKDASQQKAFSGVVLSKFNKDISSQDGNRANYEIALKFNPAIFDSASEVTMIVPNTITTRSLTEKPSAVFEGQPSGGGQ